jgi:peptide-methionine (S)-S-oxide reductase
MGNDQKINESIIFGGGCFWCVEAVVQRLKGVVSVKSGYAGGTLPNPTYEQVSSGLSGHIEVVQVEFDSTIITLENLLAVFFSSHDPTSVNKQGNDAGEQYKSVIFYTSEEQKNQILAFIKQLEADQVYTKPIVTEIKRAGQFFEAEGYHQNYYNNNKTKPYCQLVIEPKILKLKEKYLHLLK